MDRPLTIALVVGTRPNLPKAAPVLSALQGRDGVQTLLVHTGQHDDPRLSDELLVELGLPRPDVQLHASRQPATSRTGAILSGFERWCREESPDAVVVFGDVDSTMACALAAARARVPVAHVEAGLRSFDSTMPEELNRRITDAVSSRLYTHCKEADENLRREGVSEKNICRVGNVMIDTLKQQLPLASPSPEIDAAWLKPRTFGLVTLHRPGLVDHPARLGSILTVLGKLSARLPLLFPAHPRTADRLEALRAETPELSWLMSHADPQSKLRTPRVLITRPLSYRHFLWTMANARLVITDSGGVQEESSWLNVPCLTVRENTERPVTIRQGTNRLVGIQPQQLLSAANEVLEQDEQPSFACPPLWDGQAGQRIADDLVAWLSVHCKRKPGA